MAEIDDFEIITDWNEQTFEMIDVNQDSSPLDSPMRTPNFNSPVPISPIVLTNSSPVIESTKQPALIPVTQPERTSLSIELPKISIPSFLPEKKSEPIATQLTARVIAPVPRLSPPPLPRRYGDAATIPHQLDESLDIHGIIDKSKRHQQMTLNVSLQQQQQRDIQTVLEQRRQIFNKKI